MEAATALKDFERRKQAVAEQLETLRHLALDLGRDRDADALLLEADRLHESVLKVVVIGEFSRGKSTLINALVGRKVLPSKLRPTTATIIKLHHAEQEGVQVLGPDGSRSTGALEDIPALTSVRGSKLEGTREVSVGLRSDLLAQGLEIIDTPGVNDLSTMREDITLSILPSADAAIFVLDAKACFNETELLFLSRHALAANIQRVFFVVNKIDQLDPPYNPPEQNALRERVLGILRPLVAEPGVFLLAARPALRAALEGDPEGWARSGVPGFLQALTASLVEQRGEILIERAVTAGRRRCEGLVEDIDFRLGLLREDLECAASKKQQRAHDVAELGAELETLEKEWRIEADAAFRQVQEHVNASAGSIQRTLATRYGAVGTEAEEQLGQALHQAMVGLAEESMGLLRDALLRHAQKLDTELRTLQPRLAATAASAVRPVGDLKPVVPDVPIVTGASVGVAAGVMGMTALLGLLAPGGVIIAGLLSFLVARSVESEVLSAGRRRNVDLQRRVGEAARRLLSSLEQEKEEMARYIWAELSGATSSRLEGALVTLRESEHDLERSEQERRAVSGRLLADRKRLLQANRDLVSASV